MAKQQSPSRMMVMLPMLFLMNKVNFDNPQVLLSARVAFVVCQLLSLFLGYVIKNKVELKRDMRKIFVPAPKSPFDQQPNYDEMTETTYYDHELQKANEFIKQTFIGAAISSFIHFKFGVNHVVLIQAVMIPMNLYDNVLVRVYVLGREEPRIWNERLDGETIEQAQRAAGIDPAEAAAAAGTTSSTTARSTSGAKSATKEKVDPEEAIVKTWDAGTEADFEELWDQVRDALDTQTSGDQWTALMVACGSPVDTDEFIAKAIAAGIDVCATDNDGWTALHWSAFHDRPEAAETLLSNCTSRDVAKLVSLKAKDGRTALEIAQTEENKEVAEIIARFSNEEEAAKDQDDNAESELRQRKPAGGQGNDETAIEDVD